MSSRVMSHDCSAAIEAILKDMGKLITQIQEKLFLSQANEKRTTEPYVYRQIPNIGCT